MTQLITINDVRAAGHCVAGAKQWFEGHSLNWKDFLRNGVSADVLLATGDGLADQVVKRAAERPHG